MTEITMEDLFHCSGHIEKFVVVANIIMKVSLKPGNRGKFFYFMIQDLIKFLLSHICIGISKTGE
jgi:hypothetical protein